MAEDTSQVFVLVFAQDGLQFRLQLFEAGHLVRLALVPACLQRLHLAHYLSRSPLLEVLTVVTLHLLAETQLLLLVPLQLLVGVGLR